MDSTIDVPANAEQADIGFNSLSCVSIRNCTAVGGYPATGSGAGADLPLVDSEVNGKWGRAAGLSVPDGVDAAGHFNGVSCGSAGFCKAVGIYGSASAGDRLMVATQSDGTWSSAGTVDPPPNAAYPTTYAEFWGVSCPAVGGCSAVGAYDTSSHGQIVADSTFYVPPGDAGFYGSMGGQALAQPVVGMAATPDGRGYWLVAGDGGIFSFGDARFHGSMGGRPLAQPMVGMTLDPTTGGYWCVAADGGIFAFDAPFYGSMGGRPLNKSIVGMAATPDGKGYWLVASDGGVFSFGDAHFYGSTGKVTLSKPMVGMTVDRATGGYWLAASDGGVFGFHSVFHGSLGGTAIAKPIVGVASTPDGGGYWLVGSDGGVFSYGDAVFHGSTGDVTLARPVVGMAATADGKGYWLVASDGGVFAF